MAVAWGVQGGYLSSRIQRPPARIIAKSRSQRWLPPPIFISSNPAHVNVDHLIDLYALCNHSCHRFPTFDSAGRVEPVDPEKLRISLFHSSIVVSAFCIPEVVSYYSSFTAFSDDSPSPTSDLTAVGGDWFWRLVPVTPSNGQLVGFGRAVTDYGLTASIYDVMVIPPLQGMGIGQMIVKRIIRMLTSRGIYDIAALCSEEERLFFKACGFGSDILGATTMMYTRTVSCYEENQMVVHAGRKLLFAPPLRETL
ncbi:Glucosamine-phosphate N-acetyltransferase [Bertholletia excelsa]